MEGDSWFRYILGGIVSLFTVMVGWLHKRISEVDGAKVSKSRFEEFKESNRRDHQMTHEALRDIKQELSQRRATEKDNTK